ncbi:MAG: hypothetical protein NC328_07970 [Muribaculum sp.]|nr:hypothetical protein [Muribaculum sp.]
MNIRNTLIEKGWSAESDSSTNQQIFRIPQKDLEALQTELSCDVWSHNPDGTATVRFTTDWTSSLSKP